MREHLERVEKLTGRRPPELDGPPLPALLAHVWSWFCDLAAGRGATGFGPAPLGWSEIAAWASFARTAPTIDEIRLIFDIDRLYLATAYAKGSETAE